MKNRGGKKEEKEKMRKTKGNVNMGEIEKKEK